MTEMKEQPSANLIGDVIRSRGAGDRAALHARLADALAEVNAHASPVTPLRITVGDEYQGAFATVGAALQATLRLRLALLPEHDVRHGVGWGPVRVLEREPRVEDGPGWWAARDAISSVQEAEGRPRSRGRRTAYVLAEGVEGPDPAAIDAYLALRDTMVAGLSGTSLSVLRDLMAGRTQREIADALGVSASAVSQRVRGDGLAVLVAADETMGGVG